MVSCISNQYFWLSNLLLVQLQWSLSLDSLKSAFKTMVLFFSLFPSFSLLFFHTIFVVYINKFRSIMQLNLAMEIENQKKRDRRRGRAWERIMQRMEEQYSFKSNSRIWVMKSGWDWLGACNFTGFCILSFRWPEVIDFNVKCIEFMCFVFNSLTLIPHAYIERCEFGKYCDRCATITFQICVLFH